MKEPSLETHTPIQIEKSTTLNRARKFGEFQKFLKKNFANLVFVFFGIFGVTLVIFTASGLNDVRDTSPQSSSAAVNSGYLDAWHRGGSGNSYPICSSDLWVENVTESFDTNTNKYNISWDYTNRSSSNILINAQVFVCRCPEGAGVNAAGHCNGNWPTNPSVTGENLTPYRAMSNCEKRNDIVLTMNSSRKTHQSIDVGQLSGKNCGSFQIDVVANWPIKNSSNNFMGEAYGSYVKFPNSSYSCRWQDWYHIAGYHHTGIDCRDVENGTRTSSQTIYNLKGAPCYQSGNLILCTGSGTNAVKYTCNYQTGGSNTYYQLGDSVNVVDNRCSGMTYATPVETTAYGNKPLPELLAQSGSTSGQFKYAGLGCQINGRYLKICTGNGQEAEIYYCVNGKLILGAANTDPSLPPRYSSEIIIPENNYGKSCGNGERGKLIENPGVPGLPNAYQTTQGLAYSKIKCNELGNYLIVCTGKQNEAEVYKCESNYALSTNPYGQYNASCNTGNRGKIIRNAGTALI